MKQIPTAEEFLNNHPQISHYYDDKTDKMVCFSEQVEQAMIEFAKMQSVAFARWISDPKLHGFTRQMYEAMIIHKCDTVEELFDYFIKNHYDV